MVTSVDKSVYDEAKLKFDSGDIAGAWAVLGNAGDNYARNAASITGEDDSFAKIRAFQIV